MQLIGYEPECRYRYPTCYRVRVVEDNDIDGHSTSSYWLCVDEQEVMTFFKKEVDTCLKADYPVDLSLYVYTESGADFVIIALAETRDGRATISYPTRPPKLPPIGSLGVTIVGNTATISGGNNGPLILPFPHP